MHNHCLAFGLLLVPLTGSCKSTISADWELNGMTISGADVTATGTMQIGAGGQGTLDIVSDAGDLTGAVRAKATTVTDLDWEVTFDGSGLPTEPLKCNYNDRSCDSPPALDEFGCEGSDVDGNPWSLNWVNPADTTCGKFEVP